jgi:hypothetical protein
MVRLMKYNKLTITEAKAYPTTIGNHKGLNPERPDDMAIITEAGWLAADIVPFVVPDEHVVIAGTQVIDVIDDVPYEIWATELITERDARVLAEAQAIVENYDNWEMINKVVLKLVVKEINTLRALHGLAARTKEQVQAALKAEM